MSANSDFFGARDAKAVLKHGLLARYAKYFAGRAGRATAGRVAFVDGYAGTGRYDDGNPGSPLLLASSAQSAKSFGRDVKLAFVEKHDGYRAQLLATLAEEGVSADRVIGDDFDTAIEALMERYAGHAVLLFVDPFGLAISRSTLLQILARRSRRQPIDVLYHFSLSTVARQGALGVTDRRGADVSASQLDNALGPGLWRQPFEKSDGTDGAATQAAVAVARAFADSVNDEVTAIRATSVPVRQRPELLPKYLLTLFSGDVKAHWGFADMAGKTYVDWLHHCDREDFDANLRRDEAQGILRLIDDPVPEVETIDQLLGARADAYFAEHLPNVLRRLGSARPVDHLEDVYGSPDVDVDGATAEGLAVAG
jgi:three-Cys-motif partner protein